VEQLGQPALVASGTWLNGVLIGARSGGPLLTFAFPPTPFGVPATVQFGPFVRAADESAETFIIDMDDIMGRGALSGSDGEVTPILPGDVEQSGSHLALAGIRIDHSVAVNGIPMRAIVLRFDRAIDRGSGAAFRARTAAGSELAGGPIYISFPRDAAGVLSPSGQTEVAFFYDSFDDLRGDLVVTFIGQPADVITGDWRIDLDAAEE